MTAAFSGIRVDPANPRRLVASTISLYARQGTANGDRIKWFCPGHADPEFTLGSTLTVRARVKAHDEWQGTPETIVIYVEEV